MCPDEIASNRLGAVFEATDHAWEWPLDPEIDTGHAPDGRIMEVLSEHNCQGWLQGYVLTGRHGVFPCYEAFIPIVDGMVNQYAKFLKMSKEEAPWREPVASASTTCSPRWAGARTTTATRTRCRASSTRCSTARRTRRASTCRRTRTRCWRRWSTCLQSTRTINLVIASKHPLPQWLSIDEAREHVEPRSVASGSWASDRDRRAGHRARRLRRRSRRSSCWRPPSLLRDAGAGPEGAVRQRHRPVHARAARDRTRTGCTSRRSPTSSPRTSP